MVFRVLSALLSGLLVGCSDGGVASDAGSERSGLGYGEDCTKDTQCSSGLCVDKFCSRPCQSLADCPAVAGIPFDCGEVSEKGKIACYPRRALTVPFTVGHDCSLDLKCAVGYRCVGVPGTAERYCSRTCGSDRDCPARFRCTRVRVGIEEGEPEGWCRRREFCHPCVIDDQCGEKTENKLCVLDVAGNGYCSRSCVAGGGGCPDWAKCAEVKNHQFQCKPKRGTCYKPEGGGLCDNCLTHGWLNRDGSDYTINEIETCKARAACYQLSKTTGENICVTPCETDNTCPTGGALTYTCFALKSLAGKYCVPSPDQKNFGTCAP